MVFMLGDPGYSSFSAEKKQEKTLRNIGTEKEAFNFRYVRISGEFI